MHNSLFKTHSSQGFSLIEILIVIVLFSFIAYFVTQSTVSTFVGQRKAEAQGQVRDNLNYAASSVERNLRNAKSVNICNTTSGNIDYVDSNDITGHYSCFLGGADTFLASSSATPLTSSDRVTSSDVFLTSCSFTCTRTNAFSPPIIDLQLVGHAVTSTGSEQSPISITRRIILRIY